MVSGIFYIRGCFVFLCKDNLSFVSFFFFLLFVEVEERKWLSFLIFDFSQKNIFVSYALMQLFICIILGLSTFVVSFVGDSWRDSCLFFLLHFLVL